MFERYTEKARRAVFFGRYEASQFGSPYIEAEHLLLGVLREDKVLVNRLLRPPGNFENIREEIERSGEIREKTETSADLPLSNESKRALAYAAEEAERFGHKHIGTGHLLLGLLREEKCFAAKLLNNRKVYLAEARQQVSDLEASPESGSTRPSQSFVSAKASPGSASLSSFGVDLTEQASEGKLHPLIGREPELRRIIQILCRLTRNSPVLVGEPGVGKKTIVYGVAQHISDGTTAELSDSRMVSVDLAVIASGTSSRTRFESSVESILLEATDWDAPILFIAGLPTWAQTQGFLNVVNVIKPGLLRGTLQCICTATPAEYLKAVEAAPWLEQCFSVIEVKPATEVEAIQVLSGVKERFEKFHGVTYTAEALEYAVFHANSHFANRCLPEKAIDLMDEAGARVKLRQDNLPDEVRGWRKQIRTLTQRHDSALADHEFEKASFYAQELKKEIANLEALSKKYNLPEAATTVTRDDIEQIVAERTGLSLDLLRQSKAGTGLPKSP